ncbi:hypothetical protein AB0J83_50315 [Actinoplanes sp. NPDC049596]|uniref:hypothetical protein n=1 Tax=unclassified Actinoplanes TaxID=2626549 RepID=UPI00341D7CF0
MTPLEIVDIGACHRLLLRLAGLIGDDVLTEARFWLDAGALPEFSGAVVFAATAARVPVTPKDAALLRSLLPDVRAADSLHEAAVMPVAPFAFAPVPPEQLELVAERLPYCLDLTGGYDGPGRADEMDVAVARAVADLEHVTPVAVWRAWRYPATGVSWPAPRRIYLVEVGGADDADLPEVTAVLQSVLEQVGEATPQVEAFNDAGSLPPLQRTALSYSALVWASSPPALVRIAALFDERTTDGQGAFHPLHRRLADDEAERAAGYLAAGTPLLAVPHRAADVLDPRAGPSVPMGYRTDGRWIWTDATVYYLARYGLAPEEDLLRHIADAGHAPPPVGSVALHRALGALYDLPTWAAAGPR